MSRSKLSPRLGIVLLGLVSPAVLASVACTTDYQKGLEDPKFGLPNALAGQKQPGPSSETDDRPGTGAQPECVKAGGAIIDAGACTVSFKADVLGAFAAST